MGVIGRKSMDIEKSGPNNPYKGDKEFIFLSYSHKEEEEAFRIINKLQSDGYRIWYDEHISLGNSWRSDIASNIEECSVFIALVSTHYLKSKWCVRELYKADDCEKTILPVFTEDISIPSEIGLIIDSLQAIFKYRYLDSDAFYEKLESASPLQKCRDELQKNSDENDSNNRNNQWGWGPARPTFTMEKRPPYPCFNSISDNPTIGDERNFVRIGEIQKESTSMMNDIKIRPGKQYLVYIYFHNDASTDYNDELHEHNGVAMVTRLSSSFPRILKRREEKYVTATITAKNTFPEAVWNGVRLRTDYDRVFIRYVAGSSRIYNGWKTNGNKVSTSLFTREGTLLGLNQLNGVIPGGSKYSGVVTYVLQAESLSGTLGLYTSKDGIVYEKNIESSMDDKIYMKAVINNCGHIKLTNTLVRFSFSSNLKVVKDSAKFNTNLSQELRDLPNSINEIGLNLGTIGTGNSIYIYYTLQIDSSNATIGDVLKSSVTLRYDSEQAGGEEKTDACSIEIIKSKE